jgi:putative transposase
MLHAKLVREDFKVNVKVVERIYREERLWLRRTKRKKIPKQAREGSWCPIAANQRWSLGNPPIFNGGITGSLC